MTWAECKGKRVRWDVILQGEGSEGMKEGGKKMTRTKGDKDWNREQWVIRR